MSPRTRRLLVAGTLAAALVLLFVAPQLGGTYTRLLTRALVFALMAMSLDVAYGHAGLLSLGHAALAGIGGYSAALLMVNHGIRTVWIGLAVAGVAAAIGAALFGLIALRTRGLYFILVTLALGQMLANLAQQWRALKTPGAEGVVGITLPHLWPGVSLSTTGFLRLTVVLVAVGIFVLDRFLGSPFGVSARGARDNEVRLAALGYNPWLVRMGALVVSGAMAGIAGALFAYSSGVIAPPNVGLATSGLLVLMILFGGSGTRFGAAIGGFLITIFQHVAVEISEPRAPLFLGVLFVITALWMPGGLTSTVTKWYRARRGSAATGGALQQVDGKEERLVDA